MIAASTRLGANATWVRRYRCKRPLDLALALPMLVVSLPLLLLAALAILLFDRQAPLYVDVRVGRGGRYFRCLKLRTMRSDPQILAHYFARHPHELRRYECERKLASDPRVTRLGAFLRRSSIDELPQLWNVLRADMSFVGPRPLAPSEFAERGEQARPLELVRPGLTGLWQVRGRSDTSLHRRIHLDNFYARNSSLALDLRIVLETPLAVLRARGAR